MRKVSRLRVRLKGTPFCRMIHPEDDWRRELTDATNYTLECMKGDVDGYFLILWDESGDTSASWSVGKLSPPMAVALIREIASAEISGWEAVRRRLVDD